MQNLEKVSNDLEKLYRQTDEINALKREVAEKDQCVLELEKLIGDEFESSSQQAASLEALLELATRLDSILVNSMLSFEELKDAWNLAQMETIKSTRAWQAERLERASVFQALNMLLVQEADSQGEQTEVDEMSAEDVHRLLSQIMGDRDEVTAQLDDAQRTVEQKEMQLQAVAQEGVRKDKLLADANAQIAQMEVAAETLRQKHEADLRMSQGEVQSLVAWSTIEQSKLNESSAVERAELRDAVEESATRISTLEQRAAAAEEACGSVQKERDQALSDAQFSHHAHKKAQAELEALTEKKNALEADLGETQTQLRDAELKFRNLERDFNEQAAKLDDAQSNAALVCELQLQVRHLQEDLFAAQIGLDKADDLQKQISDLQIVKAALEQEKESRKKCELDLMQVSSALETEIKLKEEVSLQLATSKASAGDDAAEAGALEAQVNRLEEELANMTTVVEQLKTNQGALTARSEEAETKLAEAERTMLACMAEEARLLDEIEAGEHRNSMLEERLKKLQGIRDPIHVPGCGSTTE